MFTTHDHINSSITEAALVDISFSLGFPVALRHPRQNLPRRLTHPPTPYHRKSACLPGAQTPFPVRQAVSAFPLPIPPDSLPLLLSLLFLIQTFFYSLTSCFHPKVVVPFCLTWAREFRTQRIEEFRTQNSRTFYLVPLLQAESGRLLIYDLTGNMAQRSSHDSCRGGCFWGIFIPAAATAFSFTHRVKMAQCFHGPRFLVSIWSLPVVVISMVKSIYCFLVVFVYVLFCFVFGDSDWPQAAGTCTTTELHSPYQCTHFFFSFFLDNVLYNPCGLAPHLRIQ